MGKLKLDFTYDYDFFLIGIHSTLEDYLLAMHLNLIFDIQLRKTDYSLNFENKGGDFSIFDCENDKNFTFWSLISNKQVVEEKTDTSNFSLFDSIYSTYTLIKEKKDIDYFLKIEGDFSATEINDIIQKITSVKEVLACAEIKPETLKEINNLIY